MQRILTEEEITALADAGVNMNGVPPGAEATPDEIIELERLGLQPAAAPLAAAPVAAPVADAPVAAVSAPAITDDRSPGGNLAVEPMPAAPAATSPAPAANNMGTLQQLLAAQAAPAAPTDPYANLSKTQRRMLAFSALEDAGASLAGRQGGNFNAMLGRFNEQADMQRKAAAAQASQQMFASLSGGPGAAGALPINATPEEIDARIAKLTSLLASPQGVALQPFVTAEVARLNAMKVQAGERQSQMVSSMAGLNATDALLASDQLEEITGYRGTWNSIKNQLGGAKEYANLISYVDQLKGLNFLEAFQQLKGGGPVTDTEGDKATAARSRIDAALKGSPEDLRDAIIEVRELFRDALRKNPSFSGAVPPAPTTTSISPEAQAIIDSLQSKPEGAQ